MIERCAGLTTVVHSVLSCGQKSVQRSINVASSSQTWPTLKYRVENNAISTMQLPDYIPSVQQQTIITNWPLKAPPFFCFQHHGHKQRARPPTRTPLTSRLETHLNSTSSSPRPPIPIRHSIPIRYSIPIRNPISIRHPIAIPPTGVIPAPPFLLRSSSSSSSRSSLLLRPLPLPTGTLTIPPSHPRAHTKPHPHSRHTHAQSRHPHPHTGRHTRHCQARHHTRHG